MIWKVLTLATAITITQLADDYTVIVLDQPPAAAQPEWRLVMFTADSCGPCRVWKRDHLAETKKLLPVELVDIDKHPETRRKRTIDGKPVAAISKVPTFWLIKRGEKAPTQVWTGGRSAAQVQRTIQQAERGVAKPAKSGGFLSGLFR